ncbi:N-formylglutamate amidohydrolase [Nocardioides alpinus]|uniref:N-formylglutamate amidohydrolase n=1 Tax=Nocardioides alpinus TaxID=748909 RepID=A0A1I1B8L9_9ACTN|nr:N-formylglutamate amidohydrolase [Nocardioides alpinus]PKH40195.1 N-formylglutamate amidohydrolase [Nocardioides alpinus]SFB44873.1 N-formylglutamate amidohydrolase [Nocardioides alpinus]
MTDLGGTSDAVAFEGQWRGPVVATSVHAGHGLRPEIADAMVLDEAERFREEDPFTDRIASVVEDRVITTRSRFEADLNRPRREAVYRSPEDCWGLDVWREGTLSDELFEGSLATYDAFYDGLAPRLDALAERGPFVLLDVHSYNHRRDGADEPPAPAADNPEVNVGTGSVDDDLFGPLVERFVSDIRRTSSGSGPLDARENVAFEGRNLAWWVHDRYPRVGCVLALEFKKTFMDEWTGELDEARLGAAQEALAGTLPGLREELEKLR